MKKLGKFLLVGAVAAVACVGMVACGSYSADYEGDYKYETQWGNYGVKVTITVEDVEETKTTINPLKPTEEITVTGITDGKITKITVEEPEGYHNITPTWNEDESGMNEGDLGHDETVKQLPNYLKKYEGKLLSEISEIEVTTGSDWEISDEDYILTGATQTSGRIILAIQDAVEEWYAHVMEVNMERTANALGMTIDELKEAIGNLGGSIIG